MKGFSGAIKIGVVIFSIILIFGFLWFATDVFAYNYENDGTFISAGGQSIKYNTTNFLILDGYAYVHVYDSGGSFDSTIIDATAYCSSDGWSSQGITTDNTNIWILCRRYFNDIYDNKMLKYTMSGSYVSSFNVTQSVVNGGGTLPEGLFARGIEVISGNLYIQSALTSGDTLYLYKITTAGTYQSRLTISPESIGASGGLRWGIATDGTDIFLSLETKNKVYRYTTAGTYMGVNFTNIANGNHRDITMKSDLTNFYELSTDTVDKFSINYKPVMSSPSTSPSSPMTYYPNSDLGFQINIINNTLNALDTIQFVSNHSGSLINYTIEVQNSGDTYYYNLTDQPVKYFEYFWIANDTLANTTQSTTYTFTISKNSSFPIYTANSSSIPNGTVRTPDNNLGFQINFSDTIGVDVVSLETNQSNGTTYYNYTMSNSGDTYYHNFTNIYAQYFRYRFIGNNTGNSNYSSNYNYTEWIDFYYPGWNQTNNIFANTTYSINGTSNDGIPISLSEGTRIQDESLITEVNGYSKSVITLNASHNGSVYLNSDITNFTNINVTFGGYPGWTNNRSTWLVSQLNYTGTESWNVTNATFYKNNVITFSSNITNSSYGDVTVDQPINYTFNFTVNNTDTIDYSNVIVNFTSQYPETSDNLTQSYYTGQSFSAGTPVIYHVALSNITNTNVTESTSVSCPSGYATYTGYCLLTSSSGTETVYSYLSWVNVTNNNTKNSNIIYAISSDRLPNFASGESISHSVNSTSTNTLRSGSTITVFDNFSTSSLYEGLWEYSIEYTYVAPGGGGGGGGSICKTSGQACVKTTDCCGGLECITGTCQTVEKFIVKCEPGDWGCIFAETVNEFGSNLVYYSVAFGIIGLFVIFVYAFWREEQ